MSTGCASKVFFVMGVSGCGKTTIGQMLAKELNIAFIDADDYHPQENIDKMRNGTALTDIDRKVWLERIHLCALDHKDTGCVIACSALKKIYRDKLSELIEKYTQWVYLKGSYDQILDRMQKRKNHFMKPEMLRSQFEILEEPEDCIEINTIDSPEEIVNEILNQLKL